LLLFEAVKKVDYDVADAREITVETLWGCILTEGIFEYCTQKVWYRAQVRGVNSDRIEGATGQVEFIT
jgi:hypothetical protein